MAVAIDPEFAMAYGVLASCYRILPGHEVAEELNSGVLEEAFYNHYIYHDDVYVVYSSFSMMPKLFKAFLDFVTVELSLDLQINRETYYR